MSGYAPSSKKGKQLDLSSIDAGIACAFCTNPSRHGIVSEHTDAAGVKCASKEVVICDGCIIELMEYASRVEPKPRAP